MKDAAQDGSVKVSIFSIVIFQWRRAGSRGLCSSTPGCVHRCATTTTHWTTLPHHHNHRRRRQHVKDAAQGVLDDFAEGVVQDLAFGARAARALLASYRKCPPSVRAYAPSRFSKPRPRAPPPDPLLKPGPVFVASGGVITGAPKTANATELSSCAARGRTAAGRGTRRES